MGFQCYMDDVKSLLKCNRPDPKQFSFDYTIEQINEDKLYFFRSFRYRLTAYESLMGFHEHLNENKKI